MNKTLAIAAALMAAASTGIFSTNPIALAQDESESNTEQEIKQKNVGSGESINNNCARNYYYGVIITTPAVSCPVTSGIGVDR